MFPVGVRNLQMPWACHGQQRITVKEGFRVEKTVRSSSPTVEQQHHHGHPCEDNESTNTEVCVQKGGRGVLDLYSNKGRGPGASPVLALWQMGQQEAGVAFGSMKVTFIFSLLFFFFSADSDISAIKPPFPAGFNTRWLSFYYQ